MNKNIAAETFNQLDLFGLLDDNDPDPFKLTNDNLIVHIPHSSTNFPHDNEYLIDKDELQKEINRLTDHATDKIFKLKDNNNHIVVDFNRLFCDVERLPDDEEPMYKYGRGFFYTKTDSGKPLREENEKVKKEIFDKYYTLHHNKLNSLTNKLLEDNGGVFILDCHSFSNIPFDSDLIKDEIRPDICIGSDSFHTPQNILNKTIEFFNAHGFTVQVNNPYEGTIIPIEHYKKNSNIKGMMIEINRKLYMSDDINGIVNDTNVQILNDVINDLIYILQND